MKHFFLSIATFCSVALFLGSCNKDNDTLSTSSATHAQRTPIEQLRTFRKQLESVRQHPDQRTQETLSLTEALWDVENHFNATYSDPEQYYTQTVGHEFTLMLPVNENQRVMLSDVVQVYDQVTETTRQSLASDDFDAKGLRSLRVINTEVLDEVVQVTFEAKTGERGAYTPPVNHIDGPFGTDDNWMYATPMGKCDDPDIPSGADKELQEKLFDKLIGIVPDEDNGKRNIYLDRTTIVFDGHTYNGVYLSDIDGDLCIPYYQMNQLFHSEKNIISNTIPEQYHLVNYSPIAIEINGVFSTYDNRFTHRNEVEYGQRYRVDIDEFGAVEDLLQP